ncbi:MAG: uroporphyrinogen-III C-methyltransferase [Azonexus sp.]|nr:uroporphyrinogen-III C-methyltransferase [Azonexus sp.]
MNIAIQPGKVSLVGAGPGDPELLTLRAWRLIRTAQVVVYDNLVGDDIVAMLPEDAERVFVGKSSGNHTLPQEDINALLVTLAQRGHNVIRLKGGDPFIFGRGGEELDALEAAGIPFEIIPGITTALAVGASLGIPLTHRAHACSLTLTTGHLKDGQLDLDWQTLAHDRQTIAIYMGLAALPKVCAELIAHGMPASTPGLVVQSATTPNQVTVAGELANLHERVLAAGLRSPALILIGPVCALYSPAREQGLLAARRPEKVANLSSFLVAVS